MEEEESPRANDNSTRLTEAGTRPTPRSVHSITAERHNKEDSERATTG